MKMKDKLDRSVSITTTVIEDNALTAPFSLFLRNVEFDLNRGLVVPRPTVKYLNDLETSL